MPATTRAFPEKESDENMITTITAGEDALILQPSGEGEGCDGAGKQLQRVVCRFESGLPGFPDAHDFEVVDLGPSFGPFCKLVCLDKDGVEFIVVPPGVVFEDYLVSVDDDSMERLGISQPSDAVVLVILTLSSEGSAPTANLLGPLVINRRTYAAMQVVQHGSGYGVAVEFVPRAKRA